MRLVHHRDDPIPTTDRLMAMPDILPTSRRRRGRRHAVLGDVIWMGEFRKILEHVLRQPVRKILRHVAVVVGAGTGLAPLDGDAAVRLCAGHVRGEIPVGAFIP